MSSGFVFKAIFMFSSLKTLENIKGFNHKAVPTPLPYLDLCVSLCLLSSSSKNNITLPDTRGWGSWMHTKHVSSFHLFCSINSHFRRKKTFTSILPHSSWHIHNFPWGYSTKSLRWRYVEPVNWKYVHKLNDECHIQDKERLYKYVHIVNDAFRNAFMLYCSISSEWQVLVFRLQPNQKAAAEDLKWAGLQGAVQRLNCLTLQVWSCKYLHLMLTKHFSFPQFVN